MTPFNVIILLDNGLQHPIYGLKRGIDEVIFDDDNRVVTVKSPSQIVTLRKFYGVSTVTIKNGVDAS